MGHFWTTVCGSRHTNGVYCPLSLATSCSATFHLSSNFFFSCKQRFATFAISSNFLQFLNRRFPTIVRVLFEGRTNVSEYFSIFPEDKQNLRKFRGCFNFRIIKHLNSSANMKLSVSSRLFFSKRNACNSTNFALKLTSKENEHLFRKFPYLRKRFGFFLSKFRASLWIRSNFRKHFWIVRANFEQLFKKFQATFWEISSNLLLRLLPALFYFSKVEFVR